MHWRVFNASSHTRHWFHGDNLLSSASEAECFLAFHYRTLLQGETLRCLRPLRSVLDCSRFHLMDSNSTGNVHQIEGVTRATKMVSQVFLFNIWYKTQAVKNSINPDNSSFSASENSTISPQKLKFSQMLVAKSRLFLPPFPPTN